MVSGQAAENRAGDDPAGGDSIPPCGADVRRHGPRFLPGLAVGLLLATVMLWAYGPSIVCLVETWAHEADYSHGFLVLPLAAILLWARRDLIPRIAPAPSWAGIVLLGLSVVLRGLSSKYHLVALDTWSMPVWLAGTVWLLLGGKYLKWSLPAIGFLYFMMPLPWRAEHLLSGPLQRLAAAGAAWVLQCLGQPALAQGNLVSVGAEQLDVAGACAGLRLFLGICGLAYFYLFLVRRPWWHRLLLVVSVPPVAMAANIFRVSVTGLMCGRECSPALKAVWHDAAGGVMVAVAAVLFVGFAWWLDHAFIELRSLQQRDLLSPAARAQDGV